MKAVYALYETGDAAQRAVNGLRAAGYVRVSDERVEITDFAGLQRVVPLLETLDANPDGSPESPR